MIGLIHEISYLHPQILLKNHYNIFLLTICDNCKESFHSRCTGGICDCNHQPMGADSLPNNLTA